MAVVLVVAVEPQQVAHITPLAEQAVVAVEFLVALVVQHQLLMLLYLLRLLV
jgi:hypothetical protein